MVRAVLIASLVHIALLSFLWLGFPVPMPRAQAELSYMGSLAAEDISGGWGVSADVKFTPAAGIEFTHEDAAFFGPWLQIRDINKPRS